MEQLFELLLKGGLQPLKLLPEISELEKEVNRSEVAALLMLHFYHEMTMSELAEKLGVPLSTMTSLSKRLERKRLIERYRSVKDKRMILIRLSDSGKQLADRAGKMVKKIFDRIQAALSPEELNQFMVLALKIIGALREDGNAIQAEVHPPLHKIHIED